MLDLSSEWSLFQLSIDSWQYTVKFRIYATELTFSKGPFWGAYFWRRLYSEGLIFGGTHVRREICVSKSIGIACSGKEIYHFCIVLLCIRGQIPSTSPPGDFYSEGRFNGGFFALRFWGAYIWRDLFSEFYRIPHSNVSNIISSYLPV